MRSIPIHLLAVILLLPVTFSFAQITDNSSLYLKNGRVKIETNLSLFIEDQSVDNTFEGKYYKIVQFDKIPGNDQKLRLEKYGIEFLDYIPNNAYILAIPSNFNKSHLQGQNIRSVIHISNELKKDYYLINDAYPEWALVDNEHIQVVIQLHKNVNTDNATRLLGSSGAYINQTQDNGKILHSLIKVADIDKVASFPFVKYMEVKAPPAVPEDTEGRSLHRANALDADYGAGRDYTGKNIKIAVNDDGFVGPHVDFKGRTDQTDVAGDLAGDHGDMVAGIAGGAGNVDPTIRGMATDVFLYIRQYASSLPNTEALHLSDTIVLFTSSYSNGCNAGYTTTTELVDREIYDNPSLIQTFSAGNSGTSSCGYGASNVWGNITGGHKIGKNVIATGNMDNNGNLQTSSSRGPASDGRLKPDICANGAGQLSTDPDNSYAPGGGTSAAAPGIAGILAQMYQAYRDMNGGTYPESSLLKACLLNNAEDRGNPGPDFIYGWGRVNALRAVQTLEDNRYLSSSVSQGNTNTHVISAPAGTKELRVMLYWLDPEGSTLASKALVNDLNIQLETPAAVTYDPWVLDPTPNDAALNSPAVRGIDTLNNVEQVTLDNPAAGNYTISVSGVTVPQGPQKYYIVYTFINDDITVTYPLGGESLVAGEVEKIRWDAYSSSGTFTIDFSSDGGTNWSNVTSGMAGTSRQYNWSVPNTETQNALIRISRSGNSTGSSAAPFNIYPIPQNLIVSGICPTYTRLIWDPVPGAVSYDVYQLGSTHMEVIANTTNTLYDVVGTNPLDEDWFSVRAIGPNGEVGRRTLAVQKIPGILNCPVNTDVSIANIISPGSGTLNNCIDLSSIQVEVILSNPGLQPQSNFPLAYKLDNGSVISETYNNTLAAGASVNYTFAGSIDLTSPGTHTLQVWTALPNDSAVYNDTNTITINVVSGITYTLPYAEDFETFSLCNTTTNCEAEICNLTNGWLNEQNTISDDIDWRTDEGGTPSVATGPSTDHSLGTISGNYLYLEASGDCSFRTAILTSPCISLAGASVPSLNYWYHMYGGNMGSLHLDIFDGTSWNLDVHPPLTSNSGDVWLEQTVDLNAYIGQTINIRFRAITGSGFESDIAIDDVGILDLNSPPAASFTSDLNSVCLGESIQLIDQSIGGVSSYQWNISPNTFSFIGGSNQNSQNPLISLNAPGMYSVQLIATNANGSDTATMNNFLTASLGSTLPVIEDFETFSLCGTSSDCGATVCPLFNSWENIANGSLDDIDWRTNQGSTNSVGTGPSVDLNPGTTTGNYLYLEASGTCAGQTALLVSPCIDLSTASAPALIFGYHMWGNDMGELHVDLFDGSTWINDIAPMITGNFGDIWNTSIIDLASYAGTSVKIRFRGITGSGYESDIALDDIKIVEFNNPPLAAFSSSIQSVCPGEYIVLKDESDNFPSSWSWSFSPATVTYINGTSSSSQNPEVQINSSGMYSVSLIASNTNGSDTVTQIDFISAGNGLSLPINEDFESFAACSESGGCNIQVCPLTNGWVNDENALDDDIDWRPDFGGTGSVSTGPSLDQKPGTSAGIYLYTEASGFCDTQTAQLTSPCIDLSSAANPYLTFWYHMYGADMGELHVDVYNGFNWINNVMPVIMGNQGDSWKKAIVPLSLYTNPSSKIRFRGITGASYTSDIAIDNISLFDSAIAPCGMPSNPTATVNSVNSATLSWNSVPNATEYRIQGKAVQSNSFVQIIVNSVQSWYVATGLNPSYTYHWQVAAACNDLVSSYSAFDTFNTNLPIECGDPSPISTLNITNNTAILNWSNGTNAVKYEIQGRQVGTPTIIKLYVNAPNTSYLASGLNSQTSYEWRVRSLCDVTNTIKSDFSPVDIFTTTGVSAKNSDAVTNSVVVPNPSSGNAFIYFDNPDASPYKLIITDLNGRIVQEDEMINQSRIKIKGEVLQSGMYFYELVGANNFTGKFIIKR